jgi:F-box protein 20
MPIDEKIKPIDQKRAAEAQGWLEAVLGQKIQGDFFEAIKDGVLLCEACNKIAPGSCKKFKKSSVAFVCRTNIQIYLEACGKLG